MADDGLGVHALNLIKTMDLPPNIDTHEAGTALIHTLPDLQKYKKVIFIDAIDAEHNGISIIRDPLSVDFNDRPLSLHELGIEETLQLTLLEQGALPEIVIIGTKPEQIFFSDKLSEEVKSKMPELVDAILNETKNEYDREKETVKNAFCGT